MSLARHPPYPKQGARQLNYLIVALIFTISALLIGVLGFGSFQITERIKYLIVLGIFALLGIYFARNWSASAYQGRLDPFELPVWFTFSTFLYMGVGAYFVFIDPKWRRPYLSDDHWLVVALSYVLVGIVSMWVGYYVTGAIRLSSRRERASGIRELANGENLALAYVLILGNRVLRILLVGIAFGGAVPSWLMPVNQWMNYLDDASYVIAAIVALEVFKKRWPSYFLYAVLGIEAVFVFVSGFKKPLLEITLITIGVSLYARKGIPRRLVIILGVLGVILVPVGEASRGEIMGTRSLITATEGVVRAISATWLSQPLSINWEALTRKLVARQSALLQAVAAIFRLTPGTIPFRPVSDYLYLPLYLIPRFIWRGKPMLSEGVWFGITYLGSPSTTTSSAAMSPFGDLYMHLGLPGIIVGMFLLGVIYRVVYRNLMVRSRPSRVALYLGLLFFATSTEADIQGIVQGLIHRLVAFYLLTRVIYRRIPVGVTSGNDEG